MMICHISFFWRIATETNLYPTKIFGRFPIPIIFAEYTRKHKYTKNLAASRNVANVASDYIKFSLAQSPTTIRKNMNMYIYAILCYRNGVLI